MIKRMLIMLLAVTIVLGGVFGFKHYVSIKTKEFMSNMGAPVQTVSTTKASIQDWQPSLSAVGSVRAVNGSDLSSEVAGIVESIQFVSGEDIEQDAVLVQLRAEDDIAKLHSLEANARIAGTVYDRDRKQLNIKAVAQATVDNDLAVLDSAKAQVAQQQAVIDKKTIRAPFSGHIGIRQVDLGQYLNPGAVIVTLQQLDPVFVDFTLPEQGLTRVGVGQKLTLKVTAFPDTLFQGKISSVNPKVDEATRNVQVRATVPNPDHKLLPGMFAAVEIASGSPERFITLPQTAITFNPYGNTVYSVDGTDPKKLTARQSFVTTGDTRGDQITVLTGVKEGDEIVTSGQIKLRNGSPITVNNDIKPKDDANPKPVDQ